MLGLSAMSYFDRTVLSIAAPSIMREFGISAPRVPVEHQPNQLGQREGRAGIESQREWRDERVRRLSTAWPLRKSSGGEWRGGLQYHVGASGQRLSAA